MNSPARATSQRPRGPRPTAAPVRVAIYTRKSVEASAQEAYNSLDAQRDHVLKFIDFKADAGWTPLAARFEDNGFTGANTERPGFRALCEAVEQGQVDVVAVYRLDRISRSQRDLHTFLEFLQEHGTNFVSAREQFDTTTIQGRGMIGIIATISQMERETIAERTRDKMSEARRKGHWTGGRVPLGYTLCEKALVPDREEAERVRGLFQLYLDLGSLRATAREANRRGWRTKTWTSKAGRESGGGAIDISWLQRLLTNPVYIGRVKLKGEVFDGRHEAIVDEEVWQRVQEQLVHNDHTRGRSVRNKWGALLKGLLRCGRCGATMGHSWTGKGPKRYRYYVCQTAQMQGTDACPDARVSAHDVESAVVSQIGGLGGNSELARLTLEAVRGRGCPADGEDVAAALRDFDALWASLPGLQRAQVLQVLLREVRFDPDKREAELEFREPMLAEAEETTDESR